MSQLRYPKEWSHLRSVTEVLDTIADPALMNWLRRNSAQTIQETTEKALDIGKTVHNIIDQLELEKKVEIETQYPVEIKSCIQAYFKWKKENNMEILHSELKMKDEELGYKGTLDRIYHKIDTQSRLVLVDWKTSKSVIYKKPKIQICAYKRLFEKEYSLKIDECWIIRLGKEKAELEPVQVDLTKEPEYLKIFDNALEINRLYYAKED